MEILNQLEDIINQPEGNEGILESEFINFQNSFLKSKISYKVLIDRLSLINSENHMAFVLTLLYVYIPSFKENIDIDDEFNFIHSLDSSLRLADQQTVVNIFEYAKTLLSPETKKHRFAMDVVLTFCLQFSGVLQKVDN